jgi:hypothetical protein
VQVARSGADRSLGGERRTSARACPSTLSGLKAIGPAPFFDHNQVGIPTHVDTGVAEALSAALGAARWSVQHCSPDYVVASWDSLVAVFWLRATPLGAAQVVADEMDRAALAHGGGIGLLSVVATTAPPPSREAREEIVRALQRRASSLRYSGVVLEGVGFRAAMVRAVVGGIMQLGRFPFPHRVLSWDQVPPRMAGALAPEPEQARWASALSDTIEAIRRALGDERAQPQLQAS